MDCKIAPIPDGLLPEIPALARAVAVQPPAGDRAACAAAPVTGAGWLPPPWQVTLPGSPAAF